MKATILFENVVFILVSLLKIGAIWQGLSLKAFALILLFEAGATAVVLLWLYLRSSHRSGTWRIRFQRAKSLLSNSWPLLLSGIAVLIYMRTDQIMLGAIAGTEAVGQYSAALRFSEVWAVIPSIIMVSAFPALLKIYERDTAEFDKRIQQLLDLSVLATVALAGLLTFLSGWLMTTLYGEPYRPSGTVLAIHIWTVTFVFLGVISERWLIAQRMERVVLLKSVLGGMANIGFNFLLIPLYGEFGAAFGTLLSYVVAGLLSDLALSDTRRLFGMKLMAFVHLPSTILMVARRTSRT